VGWPISAAFLMPFPHWRSRVSSINQQVFADPWVRYGTADCAGMLFHQTREHGSRFCASFSPLSREMLTPWRGLEDQEGGRGA